MSESDKLANRFHLAYKDMEDVKRYLNAIQELQDLKYVKRTSEFFDHREAIFLAAMVAYCRSFKSSNTNGNASKKLNYDQLNCLKQSVVLKELHQLIETRRDKAIAHSDWEMRPTYLLLDKSNDSQRMRRTPIPQLFTDIDLNKFLELATAVSQECLRRSYDHDRETLSSYAK